MLTFPWPVILASASPRRRDLLGDLIANFDIEPAEAVEEPLPGEEPGQTAVRLAKEKARIAFARRPDALVIAGDTVVALESGEGWTQLGKPVDDDDAHRILSALSGRSHIVITGVCLIWPTGFSAFSERSVVVFKRMSEEEIRAYVATGEPMDKAGAYGLQGGARPFIERVEGSVSNVIGLPMERLEEALRGIGASSR